MALVIPPGPAGPAPVGDFTDIKDVSITFGKHPVVKEAHTQLIQMYADSLPDHPRLYVDAVTQDTVKDTTDLMTELRRQVTHELIAPNTDHPGDPSRITPVVDIAAFFVQVGNSNRWKRITKESFTEALTWARDNGSTTVHVRMNTNSMYFRPDTAITYTNWGDISHTAWAGVRPPVVPPAPTAVQIAAAVAGAIPPPITAADLANAVVRGVTAAGLGGGPGTTTLASTSTLYTFNSNGLPRDVRARYENWQNQGLMVGTVINTNYAAGHRYHDDVDKIILADGTLFLNQELNEKDLLRNPVICEDCTHAGIRTWYKSFVSLLHDHGFYAHPFACFRANHGGHDGFTCGGDADDDLPARMLLPIQRMDATVYRLLSRKGMFPASSNLTAIVASCAGYGYQALKQVIFQSHPCFHDQPATLITNYPRQRSLTFIQYFRVFEDYLQMRAMIASTTSSLNDSHELDILINNCRYADYLTRTTRDDRRVAANRHKYRGRQLLQTLMKALLAADSPMRREQQTHGSTALTTQRPQGSIPRAGAAQTGATRTTTTSTALVNRPQQVPVRAIVTEEAPPVDSNEIVTASSGDTVDSLTDEMQRMGSDVPDGNHELYHMYALCVHRINTSPNTAYQRPCIVCGQEHAFDGCPVLQDSQFLRDHYIRYCQQVRREAGARRDAFPGSASQIPAPETQVNFVNAIQGNSDDDSYDESTDFQTGRV